MANKTGTQIKTLAESYTEGDTILDANALLWINEFLTHNLGANAGIKDTENYINSVRYTRYNLPSDFIAVHRVDSYITSSLLDTECYGEYFDYEIEDDKVYFKEDGNYKLTYFILPTELSTIGSTMTVHKVFDKSCALWVAYRALTNDDEDNAKAQSLGQLRLREYVDALGNAVGIRAKLFKKSRRIRVMK